MDFMRCPKCSSSEDKVIDSRILHDGIGIRRRRECIACGHRFTTYEEIIPDELKVIKRDGIRQDFDAEKIRRGIEKACWKRKISQEQIDVLAREITADIESRFEREVTSADIGRVIMSHLRDFDKVAYVRFASVYRDFKDVDEFVNEIRSSYGEKAAKP